MSASAELTPEQIQAQIAPPRRRWLYVASVITIAALAGLGAFQVGVFGGEPPPGYQTAAVEHGEIVTQASATGTLGATRLVTVGSEVSGRIQSVEVETNEVVEAGAVLARFDLSSLESQNELARARVKSSSASIRGAEAAWQSSKVELERTQGLVARGVVASAELDSARTAEQRAKADLDRARSEAEQSQANFEDTQTQLTKGLIVSPIDGVVLSRAVEPGQTVASSLQAPELFVVAEDLSKMKLSVWIDEADIGVVKPGQPAKFEVAAYPGRSFDATLQKVSLSPTTTDNVVTYEATLSVENPDELLRPGMTASATITTEVRKNVTKVPNAALRFRPTSGKKEDVSPMSFGPGGRRRSSRQATSSVGGRGQVYVLRGDDPVVVAVRTGRTDGHFTEILEGEINEGDRVITGTETPTGAGQ